MLVFVFDDCELLCFCSFCSCLFMCGGGLCVRSLFVLFLICVVFFGPPCDLFSVVLLCVASCSAVLCCFGLFSFFIDSILGCSLARFPVRYMFAMFRFVSLFRSCCMVLRFDVFRNALLCVFVDLLCWVSSFLVVHALIAIAYVLRCSV